MPRALLRMLNGEAEEQSSNPLPCLSIGAGVFWGGMQT